MVTELKFLNSPPRREQRATSGVFSWILGCGFRVSDSGIRVSGLGFRVWGLGALEDVISGDLEGFRGSSRASCIGPLNPKP